MRLSAASRCEPAAPPGMAVARLSARSSPSLPHIRTKNKGLEPKTADRRYADIRKAGAAQSGGTSGKFSALAVRRYIWLVALHPDRIAPPDQRRNPPPDLFRLAPGIDHRHPGDAIQNMPVVL